MNKFEQALGDERVLILDGGFATQLETMGFDIDGKLWSAKLLDSNPQAVIDAHRAYLDVGADCIISASYQASRGGFMSMGKSADEADRLVASAVELALAARRDYLEANDAESALPLVAASIGPYGATQHDGSEYTGLYDISADDLRRFHEERLAILDQCGADVLAVETIPNIIEAQVLSGLLERANTPAWVSFACRDGKRISDGTTLADAVALFSNHARVLALGINCTPPEFVNTLIAEVKRVAPQKAIVVYPNSGETYHSEDNSWSGKACDFDSDFDVAGWLAAGATLIGGCCRTGPDNIAAIRVRLMESKSQMA
jgi:homocysteine S-methyltransferase